MMDSRTKPLLLALAGLLSTTPTPTQCPLGWTAGDGLPGVDGTVRAVTMWDPDGPGPLPEQPVIGGAFAAAGTAVVRNLARFDPQTGSFTALASSLDGAVHALAVLPGGELVAAGEFSTIDGLAANRIARFDGVAWAPLGGGVWGFGAVFVDALLVLPGGDLVAGGDFGGAGAVTANDVARWDGTAWSPLGGGLGGIPSFASDLLLRGNGELVVAGVFDSAGGQPARNVASWDGTSWTQLNAPNGGIRAIAELGNGTLVIGGSFGPLSGSNARHLALRSGNTWVPFGSGSNGPVNDLHRRGNALLVAGSFTAVGGTPATGVASWDGTQWSALGNGVGPDVLALTTASTGEIYAGGSLTASGAVPVAGVAVFAGSGWQALGTGNALDDTVHAVLRTGAGELFVGGRFRAAGNTPVERVARRTSSGWTALGAGLNGPALALAELPSGDLAVGGQFTTAGNQPAARIARWDGASWAPLGAGLSGPVHALAVGPTGELFAGGVFQVGGGFHVARWDGTSWSPLGVGPDARVLALQFLPGGDLVAGGEFLQAGGAPAARIARWDGSSWAQLGSGMSSGFLPASVAALGVLPNGELVAGGSFLSAGGVSAPNVARWNGSWHAFGSGLGPVAALSALPTGEVLAGGTFDNTAIGGNFARGNGSSWDAIADGPDGTVLAISDLDAAGVVLGGAFTTAGGTVSVRVARYETPCPATAPISGAGCPSSGGNNLLQPLGRPWAGTTFRAAGSGLPTAGFAFAILGLAPAALPLSNFLTIAPPGCELLATSDSVSFVPIVQGTATTAIALPAGATFAGLVLHHQLVPFEVDGGGQVVEVTATNVLAIQIGVF